MACKVCINFAICRQCLNKFVSFLRDESEPEKIVDPEASKPVEWLDDEPSYIPDPHAEKPDDWDVDLDGEWEPPLIGNIGLPEGKQTLQV